jgi:hypothetical protein
MGAIYQPAKRLRAQELNVPEPERARLPQSFLTASRLAADQHANAKLYLVP